ncbi:MAG: hypothetical protein AAF713_13310 [Pseudomonadota bacterium]
MTGTLVRLFPQSVGYEEPVTVELSPPAGSVGPGPTDARMRTVLPVDKREPYEPPAYMPPYRGAVLPPAMPDAAGNFDWIGVDAPQFLSQHLYGGIRRTLDCWERYLGRPVAWWHAAEYPVLELIPTLDWNNAHSGPGFIETGYRQTASGRERLFGLNFDVIAHETGHAILFAEVGVPSLDRLTAGYLAFQESFSDLIALISALHFPSVVDRLFAQTRGNLYVLNLVARIGELSEVEQIRIADNEAHIQDVIAMELDARGDWIDPSGLERTAHHVAQPLTGAVFDVLVDVFQDNLVAAGILPPLYDARGWDEAEVAAGIARLEALSGDLLETHGAAFRQALAQARDVVGATMAQTMMTLDAEDLTFNEVAAAMTRAAKDLGLRRVEQAFLENFLLRGIDPRPVLRRETQAARVWRRLSYAERRARIAALSRLEPCRNHSSAAFIAARKMMPHRHRTLD